jgi:hypothetical protein
MHALPGQAIRGWTNGQLGGRREKVVWQGRTRRFGRREISCRWREPTTSGMKYAFAYAVGGQKKITTVAIS